MLKKYWRHVATLVIFALAGAVIATVSPAYRPYQNQTTYETTNQKPDEGWWDSAAAWTAIFTAILTFSTIGLWVATRTTAKIAERTLTDLERPWIHITDVDIGGIFDSQPHVAIEEINFGRVVAVIKGIQAAYRVSIPETDIASLKMNRMNLEEVRDTIPPGEPYTSTIKLKPYRDANAGVMISTGEATVIVRGILHYEGLTRAAYETGFCFKYDAESKCFMRHGGEEYNYTK